MNVLSRMMPRAPVPVALALVIVAMLLLALPGCTSTQADELRIPATDISLADLDGNIVRLSDLRGKTVFLNFWATWCGPCLKEMPDIQKIHERYRDQGVVVIGIDLDETVEDVSDFVEKGGFTWTFVIDPVGTVTREYRVDVIPSSFFIDGEGMIRSIAIGGMTEAMMEENLAKAMR